MIKAVKRKLFLITVIYWVLLLYMIAALLWWFIALNNQNHEMATMRLVELNKDDPSYLQKVAQIEDLRKRKTAQYIGESTTFLALILVGAVFIYRATRKQIKLSTQQQNFMMAVTHELKTPIAITQLNLETLQKRKLEEEKQQKLITNTLQEAKRLNTLCNNILLASQLEGGKYTALRQPINFTTLVQESISQYNTRFPQRAFIQEISQQVEVFGEALLLQMLVNNLIENAVKYSPKIKPITIVLSSINDKIILKVIDEGQGIPIEERKKIFEKFYRPGNENTRTTKGTGLGLYLCKKIMESHNGYISMTENVPTGSIFTAIFNR